MKRESRELEDIEVGLFLQGVYERYGYDFRDYAPASLRRRIRKAMTQEEVETVSALQDKVLHEAACMERFILIVSVDVTSMFRDPSFYVAFRRHAVPLLRGEPFIRIWHAACATGEEVFSMAILLKEEGLLDKVRLYATDMNQALLDRAKSGVFPMGSMKEYTENYIKAGGTGEFSEYYTAKYGNAIFAESLQKNIVWAEHNLVSDASFNEFHAIVCRNVMIYFNRDLQGRVLKLLYDSLAMGGVLALGKKESLRFSSVESCFEPTVEADKLYRKAR